MTNLGRLVLQKKAKELEKLQAKYDEIEEWLIDNPISHPEWNDKIATRNNLGVTLATKNGDKIQQ